MDSFLELPFSFGIEVDDIIRSDESAKDDLSVATNQPSDTNGAGVLLVAKVCDALAKTGYDDGDILKVGRLVSGNLMTSETSSSQSMYDERAPLDRGEDDTSSKTERDTPATQVGRSLRNLLDKNATQSRTIHINSNEPVVLINHALRMNSDVLDQITNETIAELQNKRNIWPVRAYAGPFVPVSANGFSITLLNVVNTDIGGPNMVELLDMPCDAPEWSRWMRKDVWRDHQFLYCEKQDGPTLPQEFGDDGSEQSITSDGDDDESSSSDTSVVPSQTPSFQEEDTGRDEQDAVPALPPSPQVEDTADVSSVQLEVEPIPEDNDLPEAPEPHIQHPTWHRQDDSASLLDLIRSQAETLSPFGKDTRYPQPQEEAGDAVGDQPDAGNPSSDGGDEFVVV
ncbi:hypothetical protein RBB50_001870 [Rhinocladiella similis]